MNSPLYLINDLVFRNDEHKYNGKARAIAYCKRHNLDEREIITLKNDTELTFYQYLKERVPDGKVLVHIPYVVQDTFRNFVGDVIPPTIVDVPFVYTDINHKLNCELIIEDIKDVDMKLIYGKIMFDKQFADTTYLRLLVTNEQGEFVEWKLDDIPTLRKKFTAEYRKKIFEKHQLIRDKQTYDRLLSLREEGRITVNQSKELYRLENLFKK